MSTKIIGKFNISDDIWWREQLDGMAETMHLEFEKCYYLEEYNMIWYLEHRKKTYRGLEWWPVKIRQQHSGRDALVYVTYRSVYPICKETGKEIR